jgi:hypothetical protein
MLNPGEVITPANYNITGLTAYLDANFDYQFLVTYWGREYNYASSTFTAGVLHTNWYGEHVASYPNDGAGTPTVTTTISTPAPSDTTIPMDVSYENGRIYVLCSPIPSVGYPDISNANQGNVGKSDLWALDLDLNPVPGISADAAGLTTPHLANPESAVPDGKLVAPLRFIAPSRDGRLYFSQWPSSNLLNPAPWSSTIDTGASSVDDGPISANMEFPA